MAEDTEIVKQTDLITDPKVSPTVSGDSCVGLKKDSLEGFEFVDDPAHLPTMELASAVCEVRVSESERSENDGNVRTREDDISEMKPSFSEIGRDNDSPEVKDEDVSDEQSPEFSSEADEKKLDMDLKEEKRTVSDYNSLLSEFDDYVASEKLGSGFARAFSYGFEVGDLVWGKVKSHPWWPGHIFNEAFASPSVRRMRRINHVLVAFFGDSSYGWFDPADLIPFEPRLEEKSQQTFSKQFVRAVEEAMDEASKRSALGLTCKCRNPYNFRPTNVQDYFTVDVPDYEFQAVYSAEQIKKSRDKFSPVETLSFVKQLALVSQEYELESLMFLQKKAVVYAFRKAVFEEFDETYEQAFGIKSIRTSVSSHESQNRLPPRGAPLSGQLVIAEALGDLKSSKKPKKVKDSKKQDKFLLKRKDEAGDKTVHLGQDEASSAASQVQDIGGSSDGDFVLQRRASTLQTPTKDEQSGIVMDVTSSSSAAILGKESSVSKLSLVEEKGLAEDSKEKLEEETVVRPEPGISEVKASLKQEAGTDLGSAGTSLQLLSASEEKSSLGTVIKKELKATKRSSSEMDSENPPSEPKKKKKKVPNSDYPEKRKLLSSWEAGSKKLSYTEVDVPQMLGHLRDLSLDPFFCSSVTSFGAAKKFFLHFRSLNYEKSLAVSSSSNATTASKPVKIVKKIEDPSKSLKRRLPSDGQDEIPSAKKVKKANQIASEKKVKYSIKPVREQARPAKDQTLKKAAPSMKVVEPTMLIMKFPPGTNLPSAALLKARFGRFGLLDQSAIRVFWKSSTCRVVFLYKPDAQNAYRFATGNKSLFGNVNVRYFLRAVDEPKPESQEPENFKEDDEPPLHQPTLPPPNINLKSCLKKPVNDLNSSSNNGTARVKFMLGGEESSSKTTIEPPPSVTTSLSRNTGPSSSSVTISKKFQNVLPPSTLRPILPQYSKKTLDHVEPSSRNIRGPNQVVGTKDISQQMLNLLSKCDNVVTNISSLLGYVPYRPL